MGANPSRIIQRSAAELGTPIDINCHVEVRRFIEEARGKVRWLGVCDDTPLVILEMDRPSDVYFEKMPRDIQYFQPDGMEIPQNKRYIAELKGVDIIVEDVTPKRKHEEPSKSIEDRKPDVLPQDRAANSSKTPDVDPGGEVDHPAEDVMLAVKEHAPGSDQVNSADKNMPAMPGDTEHRNEANSTTNGTTVATPQPGVNDDTPEESHTTGATGNGSQEQTLGPTEVMAEMKQEIINLEMTANYRLETMKKELSNECKIGRITERKMRQADIADILNRVEELIKIEEEVRGKALKEEIKQREALERQHQRQIKDLETNFYMMLKMNIFIIIVVSIAWCITGTSVHNPQNIQGVKTNNINGQSSVTTDEMYEVMVKKRLSTFDSSMYKIQSNFPDEDARFWSSILAPIRRIIQEKNPSRPAVVLIATTRSYSKMAERLSREVALLLENLYDINDNDDTYMTLEASHLNSLDPSEAKSQMDHGLSDNYQRRHIVAIIHDLGSLPVTAASLLHAYCDHESAHFKKAVLLATVYLEPGIALCNEEVEAYLSDVWQELEEDVLKPLISRVANNIAIMEDRDIDN